MATTWACEKFATYILGRKFQIETNHKPLVPLLGSKNEDSLCSKVKTHCKKGWPEKREIDHRVLPFWKARGNLSLDPSGLLLYGSRIVVPQSLRQETLEKIHNGHQGIQRCRLRAKISVWWPGISKEIEEMVKQCHWCAQQFTPRKEPMIASELPQFPWQKIGVDLFHLNGATYLVAVDYFSRFPEVTKLTSTTSPAVITVLKSIFSRFGVPEIVMSDNGPQFDAQAFDDFAKSYNFKHTTSSPEYPQSNGLVERTVKTVKRLIKESKDPYMALMTYRSTPFPWCQKSPAELLMGRCIRGNVPVISKHLVPDWSYMEGLRQQNNLFKERQKRDYDRRHRVQDLPPIPSDTDVWIRTHDRTSSGTVVRQANAPRSYIVDTPFGEVRRNRQQLNIIPQTVDNSTSTNQPADPATTT